MEELEKKWKEVEVFIEERFGEDIDVQGILFIIGVQELGKGYKKFTKDQKLDVMHIAVCTVLSSYGYYEFKGYDQDKWPHWTRKKKLPPLDSKEQEILMKEAIIQYFLGS